MATKKAQISAPAKPRDKLQRIIKSLREHPERSRKEHATAAGATVSRVGEVIRAGGVNYTSAAHAANVGNKGDLEAQLKRAEERVATLKAAIKAATKPVTAKKATTAKKAAEKIPELNPNDLLNLADEKADVS